MNSEVGRYGHGILTSQKVAPKVIAVAVQTFGRLDGLVVNHGILTPIKRIADSTIDEWKKTYDANLWSALALVSSAAWSSDLTCLLTSRIG